MFNLPTLQQLGRYHKNSDASGDEPIADVKKSVRFDEYDPREEWQAYQYGESHILQLNQ